VNQSNNIALFIGNNQASAYGAEDFNVGKEVFVQLCRSWPDSESMPELESVERSLSVCDPGQNPFRKLSEAAALASDSPYCLLVGHINSSRQTSQGLFDMSRRRLASKRVYMQPCKQEPKRGVSRV
jgi:hypothetical protein